MVGMRVAGRWNIRVPLAPGWTWIEECNVPGVVRCATKRDIAVLACLKSACAVVDCLEGGGRVNAGM